MNVKILKPTTALQAALLSRSYIHFDRRLTTKACKALVESPEAVRKHPFLPFLQQDIVRLRIKRDATTGKPVKKHKIRPIKYASHADSAIYAYYNFILSQLYEERIGGSELAEAVIAFRALGKSNIDLAQQAFHWIAENRPCTALGFDVEDFFGSLDHGTLKQSWASLLSISALPPDHYAVYKSLTRHASVRLDRARLELGISRTAMKKRRIERICSPEEFREKIRAGGLISVNPAKAGVPQGSPISALLSNIYMMPFDQRMLAETKAVGGFYRRYCDDILVVVPTEHVSTVKGLVATELSALKLKLQESKTLECTFAPTSSKPLQYLGLLFDGAQITLRSAGIARFNARMRRGVKSFRNSKKLYGQTPIFYQRRKVLIHRYTENVKPGERNFTTYVKRAVKATGSEAIKRQLRRHGRRFAKLVKD